jgi:xylan 1,4-beta-xylosidase
MQLMGDSLAVLGSRLGVAWDPRNRQSFLIRYGRHPGIPINIEAGIEVEGKTYVLPLSEEGKLFSFMDQGITATTMTMSGIEPELGLHVKLTVRIPFKPRDAEFSTTPIVYFDFKIERMAANFRWTSQTNEAVNGKLFLKFSGSEFCFTAEDSRFNAAYKSSYIGYDKDDKEITNYVECSDKLLVLQGQIVGKRIEQSFSFHNKGMKGKGISAAWCAYDKQVLNVLGDICSFKYTEKFTDIEALAIWAEKNAQTVKDNSSKVDRIIHCSNLGESTNHLLAQTLHAWLMNTWYVVRPDGQHWFTVWEGSCYFHSTVDVEYTQGPFYLSLWPELLELELNQWSLFGKEGTLGLGERGKDTLYLSHDIGIFADCNKQRYPHDMEVEENANYLLLAYSHWRRTGKDKTLIKNLEFMRRLMDYILACDTTGNGVPNLGCSNTIDDASPAVQFGAEQIYLGVKAMAACLAGSIMLKHAGFKDTDKYEEFVNKAQATIEGNGWREDHYVVTLTKTLEGIIDPWTGETKSGELEGWDAYHIYTPNGLALLDMVGLKTGLKDDRLAQDIESSIPKTLGKYGCRHSSYEPKNFEAKTLEGFVGTASKVGWISMNILRDIAAAYRGIDLLSLSERYWDWQLTTNTQRICSFFETFYGNCLNFYPRGIAAYGYLDAALGFAYDAVDNKKSFSPVRASLKVPLLIFADWDKGTVPVVSTSLKAGKLEYVEESFDGNLQ